MILLPLLRASWRAAEQEDAMTRLALIGFIAVALAVPANAENDPGVATAALVVKWSDFESADARAGLDQRIAAVAQDLCRNRPGLEFRFADELAGCRTAVRSQVQAELERARLVAKVRVGSR